MVVTIFSFHKPHLDNACFKRDLNEPIYNIVIFTFYRYGLYLDDDGESTSGGLSCKITGTFVGKPLCS